MRFRVAHVFTFLMALLLSLSACNNLRRKKNPNANNDSISASINVESGDLIVSNGGSGSVLLLDSDGNFKRLLLKVENLVETVWGLTYREESNELLVAVDGVDRIMAVSLSTFAVRNFIVNPNFTGLLRGITRLVNGDFLLIDNTSSQDLERFDKDGFRIVSGGWPKTNVQTNGTAVAGLAGGGFVFCSSGTDVVRTYNDAGTQVATRSSGIAGTTDAMGCAELENGNIVVSWSGSTDTVQVLSPNLLNVIASYSDLSHLVSPGALTQAANGNILILDNSLHHIVEITQTGSFVRTIAGAFLNTPRDILVVP